MTDECICKGNWRNFVKKYSPLFDRKFVDRDGKEWLFFGLVDGVDDYYYGMWGAAEKDLLLMSCVSSLEGYGFELK